MRLFPAEILLLASTASASTQRLLGHHPRLLSKIVTTRGGSDTSADAEVKMYPALTEDEIAEKLNTIPVFGITDDKGQSVVHKMADGALVNHVFLNKQLAEELLKQFKQMEGIEGGADGGRSLQVSDVPLGMLWSKLAVPGETSSGAPTTEQGVNVQLRLIADPSDLMIARNMTASMAEEISKLGDEAVVEDAPSVSASEAMAKKAAKLEEPWGVVPVFTMYGMKIRIRESVEPDAPVKELLPWFLSIEECVKSSKKAAGIEEGNETEEELEKLAGMSINMSTLNELTDAMAKESVVDFRNIIFMPSASAIAHMKEKIGRLMKEQAAAGASAAPAPSAPATSESGGLFDEDDDDDDVNPFK